jgi:hypothetical protein
MQTSQTIFQETKKFPFEAQFEVVVIVCWDAMLHSPLKDMEYFGGYVASNFAAAKQAKQGASQH